MRQGDDPLPRSRTPFVAAWLDDEHLLVLGDTTRDSEFGTRLYDVPPSLAGRLIEELEHLPGAVTGGLHAASGVQALRQAGAVFVVAKELRPLLQQRLAMSGSKFLGWVRGSDGRQLAQLRFDRAGTGLRSLSSVTGLVFTLAVIAGQARTDRTLASICTVLDDVKEMARDQQISEVSVARQQVEKVLALAAQTGALTPALMEELPDLQRLRVQVDRCDREVQRLQQRLSNLPAKAGARLKVLEATVPDALLALGLYGEAERTLSMAEALRRFELFEQGEPGVPALTQHEAAARALRLAAGDQLAAALDAAMAEVERRPGRGLFSAQARDKVRHLARQARENLPTLEAGALTGA